ncbi:MAG: Asp-tRNA(Asn)/Glu-tRNA(Gln) amidotransferase subunit GatB [Deltaproteobacteria bacterium]|jgi:aspartyl-tRNA(Asn)/glutamyl-tRNA(Gln) amidotransferase subunit B|nr:Asp-tRNA(Asn)/Glu-tRNA(Gln) amidotransferase subunit GatB [Deltaproteobacteria bacterium]
MENMEPVIGLEIHAQLKTKTKLFCSCPTEFGAPPNTNICEICTGQPGALPRMNARALELAAKAGLALGSRVNEFSLFSRKNYFYPDLPNGFQTSQLDPPICEGGSLAIALEDGSRKTIRLNRIHLEDDAGKCLHDARLGATLVDLNRAGTPLIEIVTEPDLNSSKEAVDFLKSLHSLLVRLEVTDGRMEEGEFRCDVNISLRPKGSDKLGVRGEIKNLNSFRFVGQAVEYEIRRQSALYRDNLPVRQETLHFDSVKGETRSLRSKEEAHDYRYFPQPDLPPVYVSPELVERLRESLPESREDALSRLSALGVYEGRAELLLDRPGALAYFDKAYGVYPDASRIFSLMEEHLLPLCWRDSRDPLSAPFGPEKLATLARLMEEGLAGRRSVKELFPEMYQTGSDPEALLKAKGLEQISDDEAILAIAREVVKSHPEEAAKYRAGQDKILSFLVGKLMKLSRGRADPKKASGIIRDLILHDEAEKS